MPSQLFVRRCRAVAIVLILLGDAAVRGQGVAALRSPAGGETWSAGSAHYVTWRAERLPPGAMIDIDFSRDDGKTWSAIGKAAASAGKMLWKAPDRPTAKARIRLVAGGTMVQNATPF